MKNFIIAFAVLFVSQFFVLTPTVAEAATGVSQLAQCSGPDCSACNLVYLANGLITWLIGFAFLLFAVLFCIAGVRMVMSGGNSHSAEEAKGSFVNAIVGLIIILSAWLIVDTVMRTLVGNDGMLATEGTVSGWLYWSEVQCQVQTEPDDFKAWVEQTPDFSISGVNSYQAYVYNSVDRCKTISSASLPSMEMCQSALSSVMAAGPYYVVQNCDGSRNTATPPSWNSVSICGGGIDRGVIGAGNEAIVAYAEQMRQKGCIYSQPNRNGCVGTPGYTDCSNLVKISYLAAGCSSPGETTADQINKAVNVGNPADLRTGDALIYRTGGSGHIVMCQQSGCSTVIHASGAATGIKVSNASYYLNRADIRVIRASNFCR